MHHALPPPLLKIKKCVYVMIWASPWHRPDLFRRVYPCRRHCHLDSRFGHRIFVDFRFRGQLLGHRFHKLKMRAVVQASQVKTFDFLHRD